MLPVDRDGASTTTAVTVAFMGTSGDRPLLFPNPVDDALNIAFDSPADGEALVTVTDALGRHLLEVPVAVARGKCSARVDCSHLPPGCYAAQVGLPSGKVLQAGGFLKK